jgi:predicted SnoaL-like aldol condensation-catalyzing enzyme
MTQTASFGDGPGAFIAAVKAVIIAYAKLNVDFKRFIAEDDLVAVHSHMTREPGDRGFAVGSSRTGT